MAIINASAVRDALNVLGIAKIHDRGLAGASAAEKTEADKLSPSERAERLFRLGVDNMSQEELLAIIQKFPKAFSSSPEDEGEKPADLDALTTVELEAKLLVEKKITEVVRGAFFTTVTPKAPIIKTLEDALKFAEEVKRTSLCQQLNAEIQTRNQLANRALGLDGKSSERDMVDTVCADCGKTASVPATLDLSRPVYCQSCWQKRRGNKRTAGTQNKTGT